MSSATDSEYHFQIFITLVVVFLIYVFFVAARFGVESVLRLQDRLSQVSLTQQQVDYSRPIDARQSVQHPYPTQTSPHASASRRKKRYDSSSEDDHDYHERKSEKKDRIIRDLKDQVRGLQDKDREAKAKAQEDKDKALKELLENMHNDIRAQGQTSPVSATTHNGGYTAQQPATPIAAPDNASNSLSNRNRERSSDNSSSKINQEGAQTNPGAVVKNDEAKKDDQRGAPGLENKNKGKIPASENQTKTTQSGNQKTEAMPDDKTKEKTPASSNGEGSQTIENDQGESRINQGPA